MLYIHGSCTGQVCSHMLKHLTSIIMHGAVHMHTSHTLGVPMLQRIEDMGLGMLQASTWNCTELSRLCIVL